MSARTALERHIVDLSFQVGEIRRRVENGRRPGVVSRVHPDDPTLLKVDIGPTGSPVETPWIRFPERAGAIKTYGRRSVGEQVFVNSFHGEIGVNSWLSDGGFTAANPAPHDRDGELMTAIGAMSFLLTETGATLVGNLTVTGDLAIKGQSRLTGNLGVTGDTLLDGMVDLGGEGGAMAALEGSVDTDGDVLNRNLSSKVRIVR